MKAQVESTGRNGLIGGVRDGKVRKVKHQKDEEKAEIKAYLKKLQEFVPLMPKDRKLSKLEVITHVIEYIHDLRETLGLPGCNGECDMDSMMTRPVAKSTEVSTFDEIPSSVSSCSPVNSSSSQQYSLHHRRPLCAIPSLSNSLDSNCDA